MNIEILSLSSDRVKFVFTIEMSFRGNEWEKVNIQSSAPVHIAFFPKVDKELFFIESSSDFHKSIREMLIDEELWVVRTQLNKAIEDFKYD